MAVLSDAERDQLHREYEKEESSDERPMAASHQGHRIVVNAIDLWVENNTTSLTTTIPLPERTQITQRQIWRILFKIVDRKFRLEV